MKIPPPRDPTLDAVDQEIVRKNPPTQRYHLGASILGRECERELWYGFRWTAPSHFPASTLRKFEDGDACEPQMAGRLQAVPQIKLVTTTENGDSQIRVQHFGGHLGGSMDGIIQGLLQAPKTWHVWEHKSTAEKGFRALKRCIDKHGEKDALAAWNPTYYAQAQVYMGLTHTNDWNTPIKLHYMTVSTPGGRDFTSLRTEYDKGAFEEFTEKAERIINAVTPPDRISGDPDFYQCNWCTFKPNCHEGKTAQVSCRTCAHVTPKDDGRWHCSFHNKKLSATAQRNACQDHIFIPELIPWANVMEMDQEANSISYRTPGGKDFKNTSPANFAQFEFTSKDLQHCDADLLDGDGAFLVAAAVFEPTIVERKKKKKDPLPVLDDPLPDFL